MPSSSSVRSESTSARRARTSAIAAAVSLGWSNLLPAVVQVGQHNEPINLGIERVRPNRLVATATRALVDRVNLAA